MYTILMIDDEENIRKAMIHAVDWESLGFTIIGEASNGIEALDFIDKNEVDLLVSDIKMPIMDGMELARAARETRPSVQMVLLTGYDQFRFAKEAIKYNIIEYLLKPLTSEDIVKEFTNIKKKMDEKFFEVLDTDKHMDVVKELQHVKRDLVMAKLMSSTIAPLQAEALFSEIPMTVPFYPEENKAYAVCVVKSGDGYDDVKMKRLYNIVKIISQKYLPCDCTIYGDGVVVQAYDSQLMLDKYLRIMPNDIILSAQRIMNTKVYFGQSNLYFDMMDSHLAYGEAVAALSYVGNSDQQIVHIKDFVKRPEPFSIQDAMATLESKLVAGDKDEVTCYLQGIFAKLGSEPGVDLQFNACILEMLSVLMRVGQKQDTPMDFQSKLLQSITFKDGKDKVRQEIISLSQEMVRGMASQRRKNVDDLATNAMEILRVEYANPEMSLSLLADTLHCSSNYLSGVIKKAMGKSFVDLLTEARMERAMEMLRETTLKIREISEACGFANQHYFSFSFKKYYNQSPNAVRKAIQE